jgi:glycosyltransferase involved in cell wall biosynthesis
MKLSMSYPAVSVIIPTLNRSKYLQEALNSIRKQTFQHWEAIVVDDGSSDDTADKVLRIIQQDSRIRYIKRSQQKSGAPACRNEGTAISQGKYIIYLDSDDCLGLQAIENRFSQMECNPNIDFGIFSCLLFREQPGDMNLLWNVETGENNIDRFLAFDTPWQTMTSIWRREAIVRLGQWREDLASWQDFEFYLRALILKLQYKQFSNIDCFWRMPCKESMGDRSREARHLKSHEQLFFDLHKMLLGAELLTEKRRWLLCGLYFWLMDAWIYQGYKTESLQFWSLCYEKKLIAKQMYYQGLWYIKVSSIEMPTQFMRKALRHITRTYFKTTWPKGTIPKRSKTFRRVLSSAFELSAIELPTQSNIV